MTVKNNNALNAKSGFTFGCDPELFIVSTRGVPCPAEDFIPGSKAEPHKVEYGAVQVDGFAAEFNIDPVTNFDDFNRNITEVMKSLKGFLPKGYRFSIVPSVNFPEEAFDAASDGAKELGCSPDYNAWTGNVNTMPDPDSIGRLRCAGGHLHMGWTKDADLGDAQHVINCMDLTKQLDWYLAAWSLKHDTDAVRRMLYGKAGAHRIKPYGVEYRVLSNFWITTKDLRLQVWNRMIQAIEDMRSHYIPEQVSPGYNEYLKASINSSVLSAEVLRVGNYPINTIDRAELRTRRR